jgi:hypothetical protein
MQLWHLTLASASRMTLFPTPALRPATAVCIARVLGRCLRLFAIEGEGGVYATCDELLADRATELIARMRAAPLAPFYDGPIPLPERDSGRLDAGRDAGRTDAGGLDCVAKGHACGADRGITDPCCDDLECVDGTCRTDPCP